MQVIFCCICPHFEPLRAPRKLPLKSSGLPNEGQKFLFESPSKSAKTITAVPLKKLVPPRAHFMVVLAHCCDMLNPNTPTDMEVASALDMKCKVFFMEGIFVVFQWHQFNQNLSVSSLKLRWSHRSRLGPSDPLKILYELPSWVEWNVDRCLVIKTSRLWLWPLVRKEKTQLVVMVQTPESLNMITVPCLVSKRKSYVLSEWAVRVVIFSDLCWVQLNKATSGHVKDPFFKRHL